MSADGVSNPYFLGHSRLLDAFAVWPTQRIFDGRGSCPGVRARLLCGGAARSRIRLLLCERIPGQRDCLGASGQIVVAPFPFEALPDTKYFVLHCGDVIIHINRPKLTAVFLSGFRGSHRAKLLGTTFVLLTILRFFVFCVSPRADPHSLVMLVFDLLS